MRFPTALLLTIACALGAGCELLVTFETVPEGTTGTGGTGGGGGATSSSGGATGGSTMVCTLACCSPNDCPISDNPCVTATCVDGACGQETIANGMPAGVQTVGDCQQSICMGGVVSSINDDTDVADDMNDCTDDMCANGSTLFAPSVVGAPCQTNGGKLCDGNGVCVECLTDGDCSGSTPVCNIGTGTCVMSGLGVPCNNNSECPSGYCVDGVCCGKPCQGLCQACDIGGSVGTCVNIPAGQDPDAECPGAGYCDGNGACL